uniref:Uncharacterized protein n=1 Tax=viral metagenome TaxID=1070528 RepID=A0A6H1ZMS4_9ZZZZ
MLIAIPPLKWDSPNLLRESDIVAGVDPEAAANDIVLELIIALVSVYAWGVGVALLP